MKMMIMKKEKMGNPKDKALELLMDKWEEESDADLMKFRPDAKDALGEDIDELDEVDDDLQDLPPELRDLVKKAARQMLSEKKPVSLSDVEGFDAGRDEEEVDDAEDEEDEDEDEDY